VNNDVNRHDLVIARVFDAPIERVWAAWSDPQEVQQWWGPDGFTCPSVRIDFREGGTSILCMRAPEQFGGRDSYSTWRYTDIDPLRRIAFIHNLADSDGNKLEPAAVGMPADFPQDQLQTVDFKALDGGRTEVTVTEYGWPEGQMMKFSEMGMEQCLRKMAAALGHAT